MHSMFQDLMLGISLKLGEWSESFLEFTAITQEEVMMV